MEVQERLSLDTIASEPLIATEHILRYELAAELCAGARVLDLGCGTGYGTEILARKAARVVGVDIDEPAIRAARDAFGEVENAEFVTGDALAALDGGVGGHFDAIVCFEVLEHLDDLDAVVERLVTRTRRGTKLIFSVPNSRTFAEENPYHVTDFDFRSTLSLTERFGDCRLLYQFHAEGSLIVAGPDALPSGHVASDLRMPERAESEYANHYIGLVGFDDNAVDAAVARLRFAVAPAYNRYIRAIELSNRRLWRENARLARKHLGSARSGAAAMAAKLDAVTRELAEAREHVAALQEQLQQERESAARAQALLATPRHRAVEAARTRLGRHRLLMRVARAAWGFIRPPRID